MKTIKSLLAVAIATTSMQTAQSAPLNSMIKPVTCEGAEEAKEPMFKRPVLNEVQWSTVLNSAASKVLFDAKRADSLKSESNSIREGVSTSHVIQELVKKFEPIMAKTMKAMADGSLIPVEHMKTYSREELNLRVKSQSDFNKKVVIPALKDSYRFVEDIFRQREDLRKRVTPETTKKEFLELMTQQRDFLNTQIKSIAPSIIEKFGEISSADVNNAPFSYRDGYIVKIRLSKTDGKKKQTLTLYPRLLLNQLMGKDAFFLQALEMWADYATTQYEEALKSQSSPWGFFLHLIEAANHEQNVKIRRSISEQAINDLASARVISTLLTQLTDHEILSLLDLFKALQGDNVPRCAAVITHLNEQMKTALKGQKSSVLLPSEQKKSVDKLAKDIVFYQDYYDVFSNASSYELAKPIRNR